MYAEPTDVDRAELCALLDTTWGLSPSSLRYEPVGFGSHHYVAADGSGVRWFVTVDELATKDWLDAGASAFDALDRAFTTAAALRQSGLEFVHAPAESRDGRVLARLGDHYSVAVFAFVDGTSSRFGEHESAESRRRVLEALGRLHAVTPPARRPRRDSLAVPLRARLHEALGDLRSTWTAGPFSERLRALLSERGRAITGLLERYDGLAAGVLRGAGSWVVTHGEPHAGNVMTTREDEFVLIDWDTVAIGPRERDLWMVEPGDEDEWAAYVSAGPAPRPDPSALELYRTWWTLAEIAIYTNQFRSVHGEDEDTRAAWTGLQSYVADI